MDSDSRVIKRYRDKYEIIINDDEIEVSCSDWNRSIYYYEEDVDIEKILEEFISLKYISRLGCYKEDYIEFLVNTPDLFSYLDFNGYDITDLKAYEDKIYYNIGNISKNLVNLITVNENYDDDFLEVLDNLSSIRIYNINKIKKVNIDIREFVDIAKNIAKCILFDLSYKYSIVLNLEQLPDLEEFEDYDPVFDIAEKIENIDDNYLKKYYDSDLIGYYYRANQMESGEFKYIAYFQVLECIFDEVYLHETVEDVKQIMNSNWFSSYDDKDIKKVIGIVDQYNKNKNDREKLRLVLEKYFKGDSHDEAFYLVNEDIINILEKKIRVINKKEDLKDSQKIANIIYDFRCNCTHSNRKFPFRITFQGDDVELDNYIDLIRKISERVIVNYNKLD